MSDDRWGWVTAPASTTPQPRVEGVEEKQHFTNSPIAGAGHDALDLWAPATPATDIDAPPIEDPAYSAIKDTSPRDDVAVGGHGAPTAQWPAVASEHDWTDRWTPIDSDGLSQLVVDGRAKRARSRSLRRMAIVAMFTAVVVAIIAVGAVLIRPSDTTPPASTLAAGSAPEGWCATGTRGDTTTVATAGDQRTPTGAVAAFLSALVDVRSAAVARAAMSQTAPAPTLDQLQQGITALPPTTNGWCAQITTTDSAARVLVELRLHTADKPINVANRATFYVSATTPTSWAIDAIVSDEGSQP